MNGIWGIYLLSWLILLLLGYFLGCLNGSVMISHFVIRDDVRQHGSGNAGLTNFYRTYGARYALGVILFDMGKTVLGMETMEEQLHSLEVVPVPRVLDFFRHCGQWRSYMKRNIYHYLRGELEPMMGTSTEFPTRTQQVIDFRDQRFRERMRPFIEKGGVAVFVGAAHMLRLRRMLTEDGFTVRQVRPTWIHRMRARLRGEDDLYRIPADGDR